VDVNAHTWVAAGAAALVSISSFAQQARDGERPPRPDNASNAAIGGWCDALTGAKKEECLRDERKRQEEKAAAGSSTSGKRDAIVGPDKARCPRQGGKPVEGSSEGCSGSPGAGS
jgi:hypothetical protein